MHGIRCKKLLWCKIYLSSRTQFIEHKDIFNEKKLTALLQLKLGCQKAPLLGHSLGHSLRPFFPCFKIIIVNHVCR